MNHQTNRRLRQVALVALIALLLAAAAVWRASANRHLQPWQFLSHVVQIEQAGVDEATVQPLGWSLAILGRDHELRQMDFLPRFQRPPSTVDVEQLELNVVPWKDGIEQIAADHRIVMIMEDHFVSKHREFVGAILSTFRDAGFTHYAAEAIGPLDTSLMQRGYPTCETGLYTSDPQFGNVLRHALELKFTVLGYDFCFTTHEAREEFAATELAQLFQDDVETKLLVHAGHSHVLKYETEYGGRWLASRLWDKTNIEPFTIWQWSSNHDAHDYAKIIGLLKDRGISVDGPLLLMPPPPDDGRLRDSPYGLAGVDAIVLHPPDRSIAPAKRTTLFPGSMQQIVGRWTGDQWPVVVSAYKQGEPINAIPLDQVMLRQDESEFVLWIPDAAEYDMRVFNSEGLLDSHVEHDGNLILVGL